MRRQALTILLDNDIFGIDVRVIQEVIKINEVRKIPDAPNFIEGLINLRGEIIPLIKIKRLLETDFFDLYKDKKVLVLNFGEGNKIGIVVDKVLRIVSYDDSEIKPLDTISISKMVDYIIGTIEKENQKISIIDIMPIFYSSNGTFLYKRFFVKNDLDVFVPKSLYYKIKEKLEKINFPFNELTKEGVIKYISKIANIRSMSIQDVIKDDSIFSSSHFSFKSERKCFFENKPDMYLIDEIFESLLSEKKNKTIKVWILGNPSGEDARSISIIFNSFKTMNCGIKIINSYSDYDALKYGINKKYPVSYLNNIPSNLWNEYFISNNGDFTLKKEIESVISFDFFKSNPKFNPVDIDIIYAPNFILKNFDKISILMNNFYKALNKNGKLITGLFENIEFFEKRLKKYYIKNRVVFVKE
ncbi:MAG TPA: chemotaxis protein CheW [Spirochaetota bacterium]|nr:chemotaxis protein CheW [Spirochaetota bacterium]HOM37865.1 chemotaxis protein CheW [Spirochaetota bacterium]HPQ48669.1 chemotaxis protein CheW [Spirochaetota bacterium]